MGLISLCRSLRNSRGFSLFEILMCAAFIGIATMLLADNMSAGTENMKVRMAADQIKMFSAGFRKYLASNASGLSSQVDSDSTIVVTPAKLIEDGFLSGNYSGDNVFGQNICGLVTKNPANGRLNAVTVTADGQSIDDTELAQIASLIGGEGAAIYSNDSSVIRGAVGSWTIPVSFFSGTNVSCGGGEGTAQLSYGHAAQAIMIDDYLFNGKYLAREADPDSPEANMMETDLDMGGHSILNTDSLFGTGTLFADSLDIAGRINVSHYLKINGIAEAGTACSPNGLVARDSEGDLLSCTNGKWVSLSGGDTGPVISYFNLGSCPNGWQLANGQNGTVDARGIFIRGWDNGRGVDSGRSLNSYQGDAIRNMTGELRAAGLGRAAWGDGAFFSKSEGWAGSKYDSGHSAAGFDFDASRQVPTAGENRPKNTALLVCQKKEE